MDASQTTEPARLSPALRLLGAGIVPAVVAMALGALLHRAERGIEQTALLLALGVGWCTLAAQAADEAARRLERGRTIVGLAIGVVAALAALGLLAGLATRRPDLGPLVGAAIMAALLIAGYATAAGEARRARSLRAHLAVRLAGVAAPAVALGFVVGFASTAVGGSRDFASLALGVAAGAALAGAGLLVGAGGGALAGSILARRLTQPDAARRRRAAAIAVAVVLLGPGGWLTAYQRQERAIAGHVEKLVDGPTDRIRENAVRRLLFDHDAARVRGVAQGRFDEICRALGPFIVRQGRGRSLAFASRNHVAHLALRLVARVAGDDPARVARAGSIHPALREIASLAGEGG